MGTAYNLRTAADIAGMYKAAAAGLTVGGGAQVARFQNANGVTSNWLEHSLAKQYPCFGWDDYCFASSVISIVI